MLCSGHHTFHRSIAGNRPGRVCRKGVGQFRETVCAQNVVKFAGRMRLPPQEIYRLIAPELLLVEEELRGYTRSDITPISEIGEYLFNAGGKRIRPALFLLTVKMVGEVLRMTIRLAAVVEFLH